MRTFAQKPKATQQPTSTKSTMPGRPHFGQSREVNSMLHLQRTIGNQAVQRLLQQAKPDDLEACSSTKEVTHFAHDFSQIPVYPTSPANVQAKLTVSSPGDIYEQEADRVSDQVMRIPEPQLQRACTSGGGYPGSQTRQSGQEHERLQTKHVGSSDVGHAAAPPIVREVLRSPGQPLEPAARDFMEQRFGHDFDRIRIHADPPAAKAAAALGAEAFTVGHHIAFARERFLPTTAQGKRLVAHELTHTIQQAATSPYIALSPEKKRVPPVPGSSKFDGVLLGTNRKKEEVRVKRAVGGTQGYDDRLQAIAVARLAKAEPSAVVLGKDGKWHALETTAEFEVGRVSANDPKASETAAGGDVPFVEVHGLPSLTGIDQSRQKVDALSAKLAELGARKTTSEADRKAVQAEKDQVIRDLTQANRTRAKFILGVPESEIQFNVFSAERTAGKVNITGQPGIGSHGGAHGAVSGQGGVDFTPTMITAFEIDLPELKDPARAQSNLFHEVSHLKDYQFAQKWIKNYETEAKRIFVRGEPGWKPLKEWLDAQVTKKRLTKADVELILDETVDVTATTEARANVHTFLAVLQAGDSDQATKGIVGYANALKPGGYYGSPAKGSEVQAALVKELKTAYRQMSKEMQRQYDAAVAAAKKENSSAWISELDFSKRAGR